VELHPLLLGGQVIDDGLAGLEVVVQEIKLLSGRTVEHSKELAPNVQHRLVQILARAAAELKRALGLLGQGVSRLHLNQIRRVVESNVYHTATLAVEVIVVARLVSETREDALKGLAYVDSFPVGARQHVVDFLYGARQNLVGDGDQMLEGGVHLNKDRLHEKIKKVELNRCTKLKKRLDFL